MTAYIDLIVFEACCTEYRALIERAMDAVLPGAPWADATVEEKVKAFDGATFEDQEKVLRMIEEDPDAFIKFDRLKPLDVVIVCGTPKHAYDTTLESAGRVCPHCRAPDLDYGYGLGAGPGYGSYSFCWTCKKFSDFVKDDLTMRQKFTKQFHGGDYLIRVSTLDGARFTGSAEARDRPSRTVEAVLPEEIIAMGKEEIARTLLFLAYGVRV